MVFSRRATDSHFCGAEQHGKITEYPARCAPLAQLDRASDYESEGREFESLRARHIHFSAHKIKVLPNHQRLSHSLTPEDRFILACRDVGRERDIQGGPYVIDYLGPEGGKQTEKTV